ncbi:MAG: aminotransferase class IV [candidate division NC10 bacterium]|nr:aminotransferase class IV [candidate division NC10 bacterium]
MQTVYFNKQFVPLSEAKVSIRTNALHYGSGVFEGIRAYWNATQQQLFVFKLPEHYERMVSNCKVLKLKLDHDVKELCAITVDLLRRNQPREDTYIRPIAYISSEGLGPKLLGYETGFAIYTIPLGDYIDTSVGIKVGFSSWRRISDNTIPARGLTVTERQVGRTELYVADEVFLCGTGAQVAPVIQVDRRPVGSGKMGPITARIQQLYFEVVKGNHPKYRHWCTPVY